MEFIIWNLLKKGRVSLSIAFNSEGAVSVVH